MRVKMKILLGLQQTQDYETPEHFTFGNAVHVAVLVESKDDVDNTYRETCEGEYEAIVLVGDARKCSEKIEINEQGKANTE